MLGGAISAPFVVAAVAAPGVPGGAEAVLKATLLLFAALGGAHPLTWLLFITLGEGVRFQV